MEKNSEDEFKSESKPSPAEFDLFLPWACRQLQLQSTIQVIKVYQNEYVSAAMTDRSKRGKSRGKIAPSRMDVTTDEKEEHSASGMNMNQIFDRHATKIIQVQAIYDYLENLVQIKFERNSQLPRIMIKVIGLIIQFQPYLNSIVINGGLNQYTIYEICKFLPTNHITDICLDDCVLKEPNYHLLLENKNFLKCLSLSRCKIDDATVKILCSELIYPLPASKTLSVLNLSSNRITDEGATYLADVLRSNRQLSYLNLSSNTITDKGAAEIFSTLMRFPLTAEEVLTSKTRYMTYLKIKNEMIASAIRDLRLEDADKKLGKRKSIRAPTPAAKKVKADVSQKSLQDSIKLADVDTALVEKAISLVENSIGEYTDPYSNFNTIIKDGVRYCNGNNSLCCLIVSYNCLSYLSLKKIRSVLLYQKLEDRVPKGLLSVSVEGNCVPIACKELSQIDDILEINLMAQSRKLSVSKKRPQGKSVR